MKTKTKIKKCMVCQSTFKPHQLGQKACSPKCAIEYARASRVYFDMTKKKKAAPTMADERALTQGAFNAYIRKRDEGKRCISCGIDYGQMQAGHYRTRAAAPQLAYNTYNVHLQCSQCNNSKSGNIVPFRAALIDRIGAERVEALENNDERAGYTVEYLKRLRKIFAERARHLDRVRCLNTSLDGGF